MDLATATWLTSQAGKELLASGFSPDSLSDATRLRKLVSSPQAAAVMEQLELRARAKVKFGQRAQELFFTRDGLEQATRPAVAQWRAQRFVDAGVGKVVDLGCGIGADSLAMIDAGLDVLPVELDPVTARFAAANLGVSVQVADATSVELPPQAAVFCDPARRTASGRTWRVADFTPPWSFVMELLGRDNTCLKLGPGVPNALLPDEAECLFVSHRGDVVEASVWSTPGTQAQIGALLLPEGRQVMAEPANRLPVGEPVVGGFLIDPNGALARAGLVDQLGADLGASRAADGIAYLIVEDANDEFAWLGDWFQVDAVLPLKEKAMRRYVVENQIGRLEIKKRGIDVDPAILRKRLRPAGSNSSTLVLTPAGSGSVAVFCSRHSWHSV